MTDSDLKILLDNSVERINRHEFIADDPVSFPHRFTDLRDIEIASVLCAHIAWGKRQMICRDCDRMLSMMGDEPYRYVMEADIDAIDPDRNIHRTFFGRDLAYFLRGLRAIYKSHQSLEEFAKAAGAPENDLPAWRIAEAINEECRKANQGLHQSERCLPDRLESTPLKRLNMAIRWLVRRDGIVDMGVWKALDPSQLFIPLDVHVADTSRALGLLTRKSNDRKAVVELTNRLKTFDPSDPVKYDFALFGLGIEGSELPENK